MREDRLDLLRRLTAASQHWALFKSGGDIDSFAPRSDWPALTEAVSEWARATGRGPVLTCGHIEGTLVVVAVEPGAPVLLEQVDLIDHRLLHGTALIRAAELTADATVVAEGYRRVAPWAEGVARLLLDDWSIRRPPDESITALLHDAPATLDPRLRAIARGSSPRRQVAWLELRTFAAALARPVAAVRRGVAAPARRHCPILRALRAGRRVGGDLDTWLAEVERAHRDTVSRDGYR
jgi:hypothetical protein